MLELIDVSKHYDAPGTNETNMVLDHISLEVDTGDSLAVVGPSGSGKSTLLNIIGALDQPSAGQIKLDGTDFSTLSQDKLADIRNQQIGFVFQLHHLLPQCTVMENVLVPTLVREERDEQSDRERATELLERVNLSELKLHRPGELSGGQRQRVALVRALINRPTLLLADEPTGSLDSETSRKVMDLLLELNRSENVALIMVSHAESVAVRADTVYRLTEGHLTRKND